MTISYCKPSLLRSLICHYLRIRFLLFAERQEQNRK